MQNIQTTQQILSLALELSTPTLSNQTQHIQKLQHYEFLIEKSTNFKHELLMEIREEELKQHSFQIINHLIKQNNRLQKKVTILQQQLVNKVKEFADIKKISIRCIAAEEQLRKMKCQNQNIQQIEETLIEVKREIGELINTQKRSLQKIDDPCIILNRQRDQLLALKKTVQSRSQQFELSWKINKGLSQSLNKRQQLHNQTVRILLQLFTKPLSHNVIYQQKIRQLSSQQRQLILNYQKSLIKLRDENNVQNNKIIELQNLLSEQKTAKLKLISEIEKCQLISIQEKTKITKLQDQIKNAIRISQAIKKDNKNNQNNLQQIEELQTIKNTNDRYIQLLKQSNQQKVQIKLENEKLNQQNNKLSNQILSIKQINNNLITVNKSQSQSIESYQQSLKQIQKNNQTISNLQKQINLLNQTNLSLNNTSQKISNENMTLINKIQEYKNKVKGYQNFNNQHSQTRALNINEEYSLQQSNQIVEENLNQLNEIIYLMTFQH